MKMKMKMIYYWSKQGEGLDGLRVFDGKGKCENATKGMCHNVKGLNFMGLQHRPLYHL